MTQTPLPQIKATPNFNMRTFTIRTSNGSKYRTTKMRQDEFASARHWTQTDWRQFLKGDEYFVIK